MQLQVIQKIEREGLSSEIVKKINRKTKATTFSGYLLTCIKKLRDVGNLDDAKLTESYYYKYMYEFNPKKFNQVEIIGWKGKDSIDINKDLYEDVSIVEYRKSKSTGEIEKSYHTISKDNVNFMKNLIINKLNIGEKIKYKALARIIIQSYKLDIDIEAFNGGKNRSLSYFPLYYYPIKIMESVGLIKYSGRGVVERLK